MGIFKFSLHRSGAWILAATKQSGATFQRGNRRAKQWSRPLEHVQGVTRGPSILVPHTSLGARKLQPSEAGKKVHWYPAPGPGETVEFSLYFVRPDAPTSWGLDETVVDVVRMAGGNRLFILASSRPSPRPFLETIETLLQDNVVRMDNTNDFMGGSFLWVTESQDRFRLPMIVDLPVPIGRTVAGAC
jgi:hypothetical protein